MDEQDKTSNRRPSSSLGDVLLERGRHSSDEDIGTLWTEQKRMREEDSLLEIEYRQAKQKARALKKRIKEHQIGDETLFGDDLKHYMPGVSVSPALNRTKGALRGVVHSGWSKLSYLPKSLTRRSRIALVLVAVVAGSLVFAKPLIFDSGAETETSTLGQSTGGQGTGGKTDLPVETPAFSLLYPSEVNPSNVQTVRVSPAGADQVYAYIDKIGEAQLRISQQQLPANFQADPASELQKLATGFQATNVIELDGSKIFHGYNDQAGGTQSLIFIKKNLLILIASSKKLDDDVWAGYISSFR